MQIFMAVNDKHFESKLKTLDKDDKLLIIIYFVRGKTDKLDNKIKSLASTTTVIIRVDFIICVKTANYFGVDTENPVPQFYFRKSGINLRDVIGFDKKLLQKMKEIYENNVDDQVNINELLEKVC